MNESIESMHPGRCSTALAPHALPGRTAWDSMLQLLLMLLRQLLLPHLDLLEQEMGDQNPMKSCLEGTLSHQARCCMCDQGPTTFETFKSIPIVMAENPAATV